MHSFPRIRPTELWPIRHPWSMRLDPRSRLPNIARAVLGSVFVIGFGWMVGSFVRVYDVLARDAMSGVEYLPLARVIAWIGIVGSVLWAAVLSWERIRDYRPIGWTPLIAVPLIVAAEGEFVQLRAGQTPLGGDQLGADAL